jgi:hypothetical protein
LPVNSILPNHPGEAERTFKAAAGSPPPAFHGTPCISYGTQSESDWPPLSEYELEAIRQNGMWPTFQQWKRDLAAILPYYWDFSGYTQLARTDTMFLDVLHVKPEVGMAILRHLLGQPDSGCPQMGVVVDAGLRVDSHNIDQVLALQDQCEHVANAQPNKYSDVASQAITRLEKLASR